MTPKEMVLLKYPKAEVTRPYKRFLIFKQIRGSMWATAIGRGLTEDEAWLDAYNRTKNEVEP